MRRAGSNTERSDAANILEVRNSLHRDGTLPPSHVADFAAQSRAACQCHPGNQRTLHALCRPSQSMSHLVLLDEYR